MIAAGLVAVAFLAGYWLGCNRDLAAWLPDWHRDNVLP